jgi:hypothetical protein
MEHDFRKVIKSVALLLDHMLPVRMRTYDSVAEADLG